MHPWAVSGSSSNSIGAVKFLWAVCKEGVYMCANFVITKGTLDSPSSYKLYMKYMSKYMLSTVNTAI